MKIRDQKTKQSFINYLQENPELRFWQSLVSWSGYRFIFGSKNPDPTDHSDLKDTFYIEAEEVPMEVVEW